MIWRPVYATRPIGGKLISIYYLRRAVVLDLIACHYLSN
jgi:hypothetical protein